MIQPLDIQSPKDWLVHAHYFNKLWHQCDDFIREPAFSEMNIIDQNFYTAKRQMLLSQKNDCQLTALRLAYDNRNTNPNHNLILAIDSDEKGISGDGTFYSLYDKDYPQYKCHIPHSVLVKLLTKKEQQFFKITPIN